MCCNPANGRVEFWGQLAFKSSFITKNKMKACQLTRTKIQQKCYLLIVVIQLRRNPKLCPALISTWRIFHGVISGKSSPVLNWNISNEIVELNFVFFTPVDGNFVCWSAFFFIIHPPAFPVVSEVGPGQKSDRTW